MFEVTGLLVFIIVIGAGLSYWDSPLRNRGRYTGPVFDPQRPLIRRAGAERIGMTGKQCYFCDQVTYGYSEWCGRCKRVSPQIPIAPVESSAYPVPPSPLASEGPPFPRLISLNTQTQTLRHDPAETATKVHPTSLSTATDPSPRGTRRVGGGAAS